MKKKTFCFVTLLVTLVLMATGSQGSRILIAAPHGTKSHQNSYVPLTKELVKRGHDVVIITNNVNGDLAKLDQVRQIWMEELVIDMSIFPNPFHAQENFLKKFTMFLEFMKLFLTLPVKIAETMYADARVQHLMTTESFDLIMLAEVCGPACYPFGWHFQAPVIAMSPNVLFPGRGGMLGDDEHLSYVPFVLTSFTDQMSFFQRIANVIISKLFTYVAHDWNFYKVESIYKRLANKPNSPSLIEMEKNISLVFTNSHPTFSYPRTMPPQVIEVGGLHCRPAKPLPTEMDQFVSGSDAGFIIFGIGSALAMEDMPEEVIKSFIKAFSRLPQRVIWQWKGQIRPDLSKNILPVAWLPQQDLLGHPNCRAFITHGGLNSLQEAMYHGVPVLGLPFGTDQVLNVGRAVKEGYAFKLVWTDVTHETLSKAIQELLHNSSYNQAAKKMSTLFRDQLQTPMERAVYWTEFILRHQGADHLRLGSVDLAPYQRALVDVYGILALVALLPFLVLFFCVRKCSAKHKTNETGVEKKKN